MLSMPAGGRALTFNEQVLGTSLVAPEDEIGAAVLFHAVQRIQLKFALVTIAVLNRNVGFERLCTNPE